VPSFYVKFFSHIVKKLAVIIQYGIKISLIMQIIFRFLLLHLRNYNNVKTMIILGFIPKIRPTNCVDVKISVGIYLHAKIIHERWMRKWRSVIKKKNSYIFNLRKKYMDDISLIIRNTSMSLIACNTSMSLIARNIPLLYIDLVVRPIILNCTISAFSFEKHIICRLLHSGKKNYSVSIKVVQ